MQFRKWAREIVKDYTIKGFAMDDERLKSGEWNLLKVNLKNIELFRIGFMKVILIGFWRGLIRGRREWIKFDEK